MPVATGNARNARHMPMPQSPAQPIPATYGDVPQKSKDS